MAIIYHPDTEGNSTEKKVEEEKYFIKVIHYYHQQGHCGSASFIYYYFPPINRGYNLAHDMLKMVHHLTQSVSLGTRQITIKTPNIDIHSFILQKVVIENIYLLVCLFMC